MRSLESRLLLSPLEGPGIFPVEQFLVGNGPGAVAAGDFDGDGTSDLVTANMGDGSVSVLLGRGDGTLTAPIAYTVGSNPYSVAVGDFNGDGPATWSPPTPMTIVCRCCWARGRHVRPAECLRRREPTRIRWRWGTSTATGPAIWSPPTTTATACQCCWVRGTARSPRSGIAVGSYPYSVAVGDFNGDGASDLVTANIDGNSVSVLMGQGDGTFAAQVPTRRRRLPVAVACGDFNGDGASDLVTANADNSVSVLLGQGDGTFAAPNAYAVGS